MAFNDDVELIADTCILYRRVSPTFVDWINVDQDGKPRLSGGAFQDYKASVAQEQYGLPGACMSVGVDRVLQELGRDPSEMLDGYAPTYGLARLTAGDARRLTSVGGEDLAQGVMMNPTDAEPWHAVVYSKTAAKKNKTTQSRLADIAEWEVLPGPPSPA